MSVFSSLGSAALKQAVALALGAAAIVSCSQSEKATPPNASDHPRIVSLNPCIDAILVEVAPPDQILALSHYSRSPSASSVGTERARQFGVTGGTVEEILALEPDLVLAGTFLSPATRSALDQMDLRVETFGSPTTVADSLEQVEKVARLVGPRARANGLLQKMQIKSWPPVNPPIPDGSERQLGPAPSALFWQSGEIVPGSETLVAELLIESGFTDHAAALGLSQADKITLEQVLANPPDVLFVAGDSAGQRHPALETLESFTHSLDPRLLFCGGTTIPLLRDELAQVRRNFEDARR